VLATADERGWRITQIWNTHWHPDHTAGNAAVRDATGAPITGPAAEAHKIPTLDRTVAEGDTVTIGDHTAAVMETPGHTAGHVSFHLAADAMLFPGDTLFAMGCGRLFEGTPAQMHAAMQRFAALPDETVAFGAHEYTLGNGRYARAAEPDNADIAARLAEVEAQRARGEPTLPTTIGQERRTNPFMRAGSAEELGERRAAKDSFSG
jgi:hydroxyacylglutathione hydrolase